MSNTVNEATTNETMRALDADDLAQVAGGAGGLSGALSQIATTVLKGMQKARAESGPADLYEG